MCKCDQKMHLLLHRKHDSASIYSVPHPIANHEINKLLLLYDPDD